MGDDFDERLKKAATRFTQKSTAEEQAQKALEEARKDFLLSFWDKGHSVIEPVLRKAQESLNPPNDWADKPAKAVSVGAGVKWSEKEDRLIFSISPGNKYAVLVFLADPVKMRVRVITGTADLTNRRGFERLTEIQEGNGNINALEELKLDEVTTEVVKKHVGTFVDQHL